METVWQDLRYGLRTFLKSPGFTLNSVLVLARGSGASPNIFSVVRDHARVALFSRTSDGQDFARLTHTDYADYRDQPESLTQFSVRSPRHFLSGGV